MARDISLLMQNEVAEVAEPGGKGRGGSSTMPHKQNPIGCALTLAAAQRVPGLVASFLSGMVQEHERGVGGWQAEWPTVASVIQATGLAIASMAEVAEGFSVNKAQMRSNVAATRGMVFAERASLLLGAELGRDVAHKILEDAVRKSTKQKCHLAEILAEIPEVANHLSPAQLRQLELPEEYLGLSETFRKNLLGTPQSKNKNKKEQ
jgi:3-carboxy-cis,cis-muconate cycloisomerase